MAKAVVAVDADVGLRNLDLLLELENCVNYTTTKVLGGRRSSPTPALEAASLLGRPLLADLCSAEAARSEVAMLLMLADAVYGVVTSCSPAVDLVPCARGRPPLADLCSAEAAHSEAAHSEAAMLLMLADAVYGVVTSCSPAVDLVPCARGRVCLLHLLLCFRLLQSRHGGAAAEAPPLHGVSGFLRPQNPAPNSVLPDPDDAPAAADDRDGDDDDYAGDEEEDEDPGKPLELFPARRAHLLPPLSGDARPAHAPPNSAERLRRAPPSRAVTGARRAAPSANPRGSSTIA
uniref:Uncharacterized protein n=1 Tax=Ananas comosus var. bracteatus TaxID=296719 RepID=A0A6V7NFB4_ANACO|nr:unnamed protein product [Ananas comosus var. bracteatus]